MVFITSLLISVGYEVPNLRNGFTPGQTWLPEAVSQVVCGPSCLFFSSMFFVLTKTASAEGEEEERTAQVKKPGVEGKSLLPSAVQRKLNPNNFIGIIASE